MEKTASSDVSPTQVKENTTFFSSTMLHIVGEVLAMVGMVLFFRYKFNSLTKQIEELRARVEEQDDILQKHDDVLKTLISRMGGSVTVKQAQPQMYTQAPAPASPTRVPPSRPPPNPMESSTIFTVLTDMLNTPKHNTSNVNMPSIVEVTENEDEKLDAEIEEELLDLKK